MTDYIDFRKAQHLSQTLTALHLMFKVPVCCETTNLDTMFLGLPKPGDHALAKDCLV